MMLSVRHSAGSCWTCKVRRKGCDLNLPACGDCTSLGIVCNYGTRPEWMDGGKQQQQKADLLKKEIKHNRRTKNRLQANRASGIDLERTGSHKTGSHKTGSLDSGTRSPGRSADTVQGHGPIIPVATPPDPAHFAFGARQSNLEQANHDIDARSVARDAASVEQHDLEPGLLMAYLDYAFPVLFPFYKPSIFEGGRAWLLTLAMRYPVFCHNVVGLAACFYSAVPALPGLENDGCAAMAKSKLGSNIEQAVKGVQDSLKDLSHRGVGHSLADNVRLLGNIVQLVNFEVVFASSENWQMHLTAAVDLFSQTIEHHGNGRQGVPPMGAMLESLRGAVPSNCSIWSAEQAALRFFTALVIYQDIIACTVREQASTLMVYYDGILSNTSHSQDPSLLNLEDFIGCQNWILRAIAEISALDQWKKQAKRAGILDVMDLVRRASTIQSDLQAGTVNLESFASGTQALAPLSPYQPLEIILAKSNITNGLSASQLVDRSIVSQIWADAAQVYLTTVLSGWQPRNVQLRNHVAHAVDLLSKIDNTSWLRALVWPICVTGCFATEEQETAFRNVANASGGLAMFSTMRDALAIMEKVWSVRGHLDADTWDVASCLRILGHSVLLV